MDEVARARWAKERRPEKHPAEAALEAVLDEIRAGTLKADHVIVCIGSVAEDGGTFTCYRQSGSFNAYGQLGLLDATRDLFREKD